MMIMNTPPSNVHKSTSKYLMISNHNGIFSCTPKEELIKNPKEDTGVKGSSNMFNQLQ